MFSLFIIEILLTSEPFEFYISGNLYGLLFINFIALPNLDSRGETTRNI